MLPLSIFNKSVLLSCVCHRKYLLIMRKHFDRANFIRTRCSCIVRIRYNEELISMIILPVWISRHTSLENRNTFVMQVPPRYYCERGNQSCYKHCIHATAINGGKTRNKINDIIDTYIHTHYHVLVTRIGLFVWYRYVYVNIYIYVIYFISVIRKFPLHNIV